MCDIPAPSMRNNLSTPSFAARLCLGWHGDEPGKAKTGKCCMECPIKCEKQGRTSPRLHCLLIYKNHVEKKFGHVWGISVARPWHHRRTTEPQRTTTEPNLPTPYKRRIVHACEPNHTRTFNVPVPHIVVGNCNERRRDVTTSYLNFATLHAFWIDKISLHRPLHLWLMWPHVGS